MEPNDRKLLRQIFDLAKENNKRLKKLHRAIVWGRVLKAAYWVLIIGTAIGAFYFLQPALESAQQTFESLSGTTEQLRGVGGLLENLGL